MIKSIVYLRVSTQQQTLEQQESVMMKTALKDYKENEIMVIEGKESASKLDADQRQTLSSLYLAIEQHPIERVYFFAVDRLSRKASMVPVIADELADKGIDCYFLNPFQLHTLTPEGKKNQMAFMMLSMLAFGAQMEIELKNERVEAKRALMKANGQVITGTLCYGYKKNADKTIGINEEQAEVIRYIFNEYAKGEKSIRILANELFTNGTFKHTNDNADYQKLRQIIVNKAYSGRNEKSGNIYPAIVSVELQEKCFEVLKNNISAPKSKTKNIYFGKGIVRDKVTKKVMIVKLANKTYQLFERGGRTISININVVDSILYSNMLIFKPMLMYIDSEVMKTDYQDKIEINARRITEIEDIIKKLNERHTKIYRQFSKGNIPEQEYEKDVSDIKKELTSWNNEIARLKTDSNQLQSMIDGTDNKIHHQSQVQDINSVSDEMKKEFINEVFNCVYVSKNDDGTMNIELGFSSRIPDAPKLYYHYKSKGGKIELTMVDEENGTKTDVAHIIKKRI